MDEFLLADNFFKRMFFKNDTLIKNWNPEQFPQQKLFFPEMKVLITGEYELESVLPGGAPAFPQVSSMCSFGAMDSMAHSHLVF